MFGAVEVNFRRYTRKMGLVNTGPDNDLSLHPTVLSVSVLQETRAMLDRVIANNGLLDATTLGLADPTFDRFMLFLHTLNTFS